MKKLLIVLFLAGLLTPSWASSVKDEVTIIKSIEVFFWPIEGSFSPELKKSFQLERLYYLSSLLAAQKSEWPADFSENDLLPKKMEETFKLCLFPDKEEVASMNNVYRKGILENLSTVLEKETPEETSFSKSIARLALESWPSSAAKREYSSRCPEERCRASAFKLLRSAFLVKGLADFGYQAPPRVSSLTETEFLKKLEELLQASLKDSSNVTLENKILWKKIDFSYQDLNASCEKLFNFIED